MGTCLHLRRRAQHLPEAWDMARLAIPILLVLLLSGCQDAAKEKCTEGEAKFIVRYTEHDWDTTVCAGKPLICTTTHHHEWRPEYTCAPLNSRFERAAQEAL